jgi:hypothetical protein
MTLNLEKGYEEALKSAKPTFLPKRTIKPPKGVMGAITVIPQQTIPPVNTDVRFDVLQNFKPADHPGLAAMDIQALPENFNWKMDGKEKSKLISDPGNQMLCGSCWAISTCGIVADCFVVAGKVDFRPHLSTTWCLACYPQNKCQGGNPAKLLQDISGGGLATENCVDYSWCAENEHCNGLSTKHFEAKETVNLSTLVPNCGCYDAKIPHYLFYIDKNPQTIAIGQAGISEATHFSTVKKHIFANGPVMGGFLVFSNFRSGAFTKINGGVYLENGIYDKGGLTFDPMQSNAKNYIGSHAVAILGWGIEKGILVDSNGTKQDVPYWFCRNSWTEKWGNNGYFKMAMYPYNKVSQFDKVILINSPLGKAMSGGIVLVKVSQEPKKITLKQLNNAYARAKRSNPDSFYSTEIEDRGNSKFSPPTKISSSTNSPSKTLLLLVIIAILIIAVVYYIRKN